MSLPLDSLTMLVSFVATFSSWLFMRHRLRTRSSGNTYQARLLVTGFLLSAFYGMLMFLPHLLLLGRPELFPPVMAIVFVTSHLFLYGSFIQLLRLTFSIVPRLNDKEGIAIGFGVLMAALITVVNAVTMIWGTQPSYDPSQNISIMNTHPLVTLGTGIFGIVCAVPAAILMFITGVTNPRMRVRSFLLGIGMVIPMVVGPFVESAKTPDVFLVSNTVSVIGMLILTTGVAYRMEEKISLAKQQPEAVPVTTS